MTKRPPEIRNKKPDSNQSIENIKPNKNCVYCGGIVEIVTNGTSLCLECFKEHCEICEKRKPFITVRRDPKNPDHKFLKQCCSDCYSDSCNAIIKLDSEYGIENIDNKKSDVYDY